MTTLSSNEHTLFLVLRKAKSYSKSWLLEVSSIKPYLNGQHLYLFIPVCHSDVTLLSGQALDTRTYVMGHEFSGVVVELVPTYTMILAYLLN